MTIFSGRHVVIPAVMGVRSFAPRSAAAPPAGDWWNVAGKTTVAAYQPIGAASYAASKINLANPGTYDAADGAVYPTWNVSTGWSFTSTQHLIPGISPASTAWTVLVRFSGVTGDDRGLFGFYSAVSVSAFTVVVSASANRIDVYNGLHWPDGYLNAGAALTGGVYGFAGKTAYRNGSSDGTIPAGSLTPEEIFIGGLKIIGNYLEGSIQAFAIWSDTLTAGEVATVSAAMAAL